MTLSVRYKRLDQTSGDPSDHKLDVLVRGASELTGPWPTVSVWHGDDDTTVASSNAGSIVRQWQKIHNVKGPPTRVEKVDGFPWRVWCDAGGRDVIEEYIIGGMGHGMPIRAGGDDGLGKEGEYMLEVGISSTRHIVQALLAKAAQDRRPAPEIWNLLRPSAPQRLKCCDAALYVLYQQRTSTRSSRKDIYMNKQNTTSPTEAMESVTNQIQSLFNPQGNQDIFKTWARMSERMTAMMVEAGTQSTDIMSDATKEALSNLADATQVRDEPADYSKAYSDFAQKQMDLLQRTATEVGEVNQKAGTEATELASKASEEISDKVAKKGKDAADKAGSTAKKKAA